MFASPNRAVGVLFGAGYVLLGVIGFFYTSGVGFVSTSGGFIFDIFEVNILHNVAHIVIGAALLISALSGIRPAKAVNTGIGTIYLLLGIAGLFLVNTSVNYLAINASDNVLHFASAVVLLAVGLGADHAARSGAAA